VTNYWENYDSHLTLYHSTVLIRFVWSMKEFCKTISIITVEVAEFFHWPNAYSIERPWRRNGSTRGRRGKGAIGPSRANTNWSLTAAGGSSAPRSQSSNAGWSSKRRGIVRRRSVSPQTRQPRRWQTNANVGPSDRWPQVMIRINQLYIGQTCLNLRILEHLLMALRPVMPLRTIVDQILMEQ
jgi:hypothetical protein